jgi:hypothetical protein
MEKKVFNAYIDGFNLYKGSLERRPDLKGLDIVGLCQALRPDMTLGQVFYFTSNVMNRYPGDKAQNRQHAYLRVLAHQGVQVVLGKFRADPRWSRFASLRVHDMIQPAMPLHFGLTKRAFHRIETLAYPDLPMAYVTKMEEKGSDVNLASYLLRDAFTNGLSAALVVTGDSDLACPVRFAVEFGVDVKVSVPGLAIEVNELAAAASQLEKLPENLLQANQLPKTFISPAGRQIVRPASWA